MCKPDIAEVIATEVNVYFCGNHAVREDTEEIVAIIGKHTGPLVEAKDAEIASLKGQVRKLTAWCERSSYRSSVLSEDL